MRDNYEKRVAYVNRLLDDALSQLEKNHRTFRFLTDTRSGNPRARMDSLRGEYTILRDQKRTWPYFLLGPWGSNNPRARLNKLMESTHNLMRDIEDAEKARRLHVLQNGPLSHQSGSAAAYVTPQPNISYRVANASSPTLTSNNTTYFQNPPGPQAVQPTRGPSQASLHSPRESVMPMESDWMRGMEQIIIIANRSPAPPGTVRDMFGGHTTLIGSTVSSGKAVLIAQSIIFSRQSRWCPLRSLRHI
ncbi:hypothetical protein HYDPIDRAFT_31375 [Hydnomerulius pinastri MD-312]|uniref:Uncharacterized protein n=1 Tax=Hydnomerulius pinastri MD-312 TaxID=994086 RepID=A0A0C9WBL0_9AGAM|nr:hypothetical protein HYDPIDRAFT_31375 [Hydnomerulius pinastri MD-312]